jgi:hypothetical protein
MGMMPGAANQPKLTTLTRTDFLIQFVWQPPKPEEKPKTPEERKTKIAEIDKQMRDAQKNNTVVVIAPKESDIEKASQAASREAEAALNKAAAATTGAPAAGAPAAGAPSGAAPATPAPAGAAPAAPGAPAAPPK